jgi:hypothetical protein
MPELVLDGDRRLIVAGRFRLAFRWSGDRWDHGLEDQARGQDRHRVLAWSVEGDPDRDDPTRVVSPVYQQLEFQNDGAILQALLVGQSGPHHFSAAFSVEERDESESPDWPHESKPHTVSIKVDVADRCRGAVEALSATYTVDARSDDLIDAGPSVAAWDLGQDRLTFAAIEPASVSLAEAGRRATLIQALAGPGQGSATRRFLYVWEWDPDIRW